MNYMIYAKHKDDKAFGAMNLAEGTVGVGLMFATLIPDLDRAKSYADRLAANTTDFIFQVRGAGQSKVFYTKGQSILDTAFRHHAWFKGITLTKKQALEYFAASSDFHLTRKPSKSSSDCLMDEQDYIPVLVGDEDHRSYRMLPEEMEYFQQRREFWKEHPDYAKENVPEYADFSKTFKAEMNRLKKEKGVDE